MGRGRPAHTGDNRAVGGGRGRPDQPLDLGGGGYIRNGMECRANMLQIKQYGNTTGLMPPGYTHTPAPIPPRPPTPPPQTTPIRVPSCPFSLYQTPTPPDPPWETGTRLPYSAPRPDTPQTPFPSPRTHRGRRRPGCPAVQRPPGCVQEQQFGGRLLHEL